MPAIEISDWLCRVSAGYTSDMQGGCTQLKFRPTALGRQTISCEFVVANRQLTLQSTETRCRSSVA
jgi:hypothetical protein